MSSGAVVFPRQAWGGYKLLKCIFCGYFPRWTWGGGKLLRLLFVDISQDKHVEETSCYGVLFVDISQDKHVRGQVVKVIVCGCFPRQTCGGDKSLQCIVCEYFSRQTCGGDKLLRLLFADISQDNHVEGTSHYNVLFVNISQDKHVVETSCYGYCLWIFPKTCMGRGQIYTVLRLWNHPPGDMFSGEGRVESQSRKREEGLFVLQESKKANIEKVAPHLTPHYLWPWFRLGALISVCVYWFLCPLHWQVGALCVCVCLCLCVCLCVCVWERERDLCVGVGGVVCVWRGRGGQQVVI